MRKDIQFVRITLWLMRNNKNFTLILIGQIISLFGNTIQRFALSLYVLKITGSPSVYGNILALSILPYIFLAPIAGSIADNFNKKKMMIFLDILGGLITLSGFFIFLFKDDSLLLIRVIMILLSSISACYGPVVTSSIPMVVREDFLKKANSYVSQVGSLSNILGPILGGILYGFFGIKLILLLNGISFIASSILEMFINMKKDFIKQKSLSIIKAYKEMGETFLILKKNYKVVLRIIISYCMFNICVVPINSILLPSIMNIDFSIDPSIYGIVESIIASGMLLGGIFINIKPELFNFKIHYRWGYLMPLSMMLMGISLFTKIPYLPFIMITLGGFIIMFCLGTSNIITLTEIQIKVPSNTLGKVSALSTAAATSSVPIGQVIFGYLLDSPLNTGSLLIISGLIALLVSNFVRRNVKVNG